MKLAPVERRDHFLTGQGPDTMYGSARFCPLHRELTAGVIIQVIYHSGKALRVKDMLKIVQGPEVTGKDIN